MPAILRSGMVLKESNDLGAVATLDRFPGLGHVVWTVKTMPPFRADISKASPKFPVTPNAFSF